MIRRIIVYCIVAAVLYAAYTKYMEYASSIQLRSTEQSEENQQALGNTQDPSKQSRAERALRRREMTEKQSEEVGRTLGK